MKLTAYALTEDLMDIVPMAHQRAWMDDTPNAFAYRCLPLSMANQNGWAILSPCDVAVSWDGSPHLGGLHIEVPEADRRWLHYICDHFGAGVLTFSLPYLFRTPPGYAMWVRGPANRAMPGIQALEGLVETDWSVSTFTMNWRFLEVDRVVRFRKGDPICVLTPIQLNALEGFEPELRRITDDPELHAQYTAWSDSRSRFNQDPERKPTDWQKDYFLGKAPEGVALGRHEHRTKLNLRPFPGLGGLEAPQASAAERAGLELPSQAAAPSGAEQEGGGPGGAEPPPSGCPYHAGMAALAPEGSGLEPA